MNDDNKLGTTTIGIVCLQSQIIQGINLITLFQLQTNARSLLKKPYKIASSYNPLHIFYNITAINHLPLICHCMIITGK